MSGRLDPHPTPPPARPLWQPPQRGLEAAIVRVLLGTVVAVAFVVILGIDAQQRGQASRELAAEVGGAAETLAAMVEALPDRRGADGAAHPELVAGVNALLRRPGVARVTVFDPRGATPYAATAAGPTSAPWAHAREVPAGQAINEERLRVSRPIRGAGGRDGLVVVEVDAARAIQRHAEWVAAAARMFLLVVLLALGLAPLAARALAAPWSRALRRIHGHAIGEGNPDTDPEFALEAVARAFEGRIGATEQRDAGPPQPPPADDADGGRAEFLSNTGHELRTPLHAVTTTAALLQETPLAPDQRALVAQLVDAAKVLTESVEDLDELALLGRGDLQLEPSELEPEALVDAVIELVAPLARDRHVEVLPRVDLSVPRTLVADARRLRRLLLHLVDNAVRNTAHGVVEVRLVVVGEAEHAQLAVEVRDNGAGISAEKQAGMLGDLASIQRGERGLRGGLGVGLVVSAKIARAMGGALTFESAILSGSVFRAHLPVGVGVCEAHDFPSSGKRALVLGELPRTTSHLVDLLVEDGAEVATEATAYAGFEALARGEAFDYVLVDATLAGRDAFLGGVETMPGAGGRAPRIVLVHPTLGRRLPDVPTDEAVAAQLARPVTRRALRRALWVADQPRAAPPALDAISDPPLERHAGTPRRPEDDRAPAAAVAGPEEPPSASLGRPVRVLLVDDNATNRQLVQYLLAKRGYAVDVAVDGQRALEAFGVGDYDVVLMDCQMPVMDGFEATRRIRELERGRARRVPVLAMSAGAFGDDVQACKNAGMDDHIAKPFQPKAMLAWLESWVTRSLQDPEGAVGATPRPRTTARDAGLVPNLAPSPLPTMTGAVDEGILGPLLDDDDGRALAEELVDSFVTAGPETVAGLEARLEAGDLRDVARLAHRFVSTSGSVGAMRLARLLREVESAAERGQREEAQRLVARAGGEVEVARRVLEGKLGAGAASLAEE